MNRSSYNMNPNYADGRAFCDIESEYPEAAYNTVKVALHLQQLIYWVYLFTLCILSIKSNFFIITQLCINNDKLFFLDPF